MKGVPYNMYIMCGDIRTVEFNSEFEYEILNEKLAPLYILNRGNIRRWIEERAADGARANTRAVKGYQRISKTAGDYQTAMKVNAAVITSGSATVTASPMKMWFFAKMNTGVLHL